MSDWLDLELSHHLAPTEAPDELWGRVCAARAARRPAPHFALPVAAVVTLMLAGALYFIARGAPAPQQYRGYTANAHSECASCHTTL
jgi:hypothetical protein